MTKEELSEILHSTGIPVNEWIASKENEKQYPRCVYWPYIDQDIVASDESYTNNRTYQVSIYALKPDIEEIAKIRERLREHNLHPVIYHEYVAEDKVFHTYFALDVIE